MGRPAHVRIVAPARAVSETALSLCQTALQDRGFRVSVGAHLFDRDESPLDLAGKDVDRASDLMAALTDPEVDWVLAARGGYGAMRVLPYVDWGRLAHLPAKPLVGFSDITALHLALAGIGWPSIHGPNADQNWSGDAGEACVRWLVRGELDLSERPLRQLTDASRAIAAVPWRGGNLSLVAALIGTPYEPCWDNVVLYLEEVHERAYRIDRLLQQLRLSGRMAKVVGIVFGDAVFDGEDETPIVQDLLKQFADDVGIPAWWGLSSSHREPMMALPLGVPLTIDTENRVRVPPGVRG